MNEKKIEFVEPRWPVVLAILALLLLLAMLPNRVRVFPRWAPYTLTLVLIMPMIALMVSAQKKLWLRVEAITMAVFFAVDGVWIFIELAALIGSMVSKSGEITGIQLLTSSIVVWATNVLMFALAYWRIDRGGPEARMNHVKVMPDWSFPQEGLRDQVPQDWHPRFVDYLFLGFSAATAFSPTDALPLTGRAKMLMMLESVISLVTIIAVAARAINILGS